MTNQKLTGLLLLLALTTLRGAAQSPHRAIEFMRQGIVLAEKGDFDGAITAYTRAIELNSNIKPQSDAPPQSCVAPLEGEILISDQFNAMALNNRGFAYYRKQNYEKAIADFDRAIRMAPRLADAYNNRGNIRLIAGALDQAMLDFNRAIQLNPQHALAFNNRANVHQAKGNLVEALTDYTQAIKLAPSRATAYANRGLTLLQLGKEFEAKADFNRALELNPDLKSQLLGLIRSEPQLANSPQ